MNRNNIIETLQQGVTEVQFTKVDGSERTMKCTLNAEYLPELEHNSTQDHPVDFNSVTVWDVEANSWRRFRVENVHSVKQLLTE